MQNRIGALGLLLVGTSALSIATAASAQTEVSQSTHFYNIPAQPLGAALNAYAEATGIDLVVSPDVVSGKRSHALKGNYSADAALDQLLRGTSLSYRMSSAGSLIVEMPGKPVQVSASAPLNSNFELAQNDAQPQATAAQPADQQPDSSAIVVTGVRASMQRARDIK
jgi:type II secretory pathway component GspD/PulD (secretin)